MYHLFETGGGLLEEAKPTQIQQYVEFFYFLFLGMLMYHLFESGGGLLEEAKPTQIQQYVELPSESLPTTKRAPDAQVSFTYILGLFYKTKPTESLPTTKRVDDAQVSKFKRQYPSTFTDTAFSTLVHSLTPLSSDKEGGRCEGL
jgi:hypothetical protein